MAYASVSMGLTSQGEVLNSSYWTNAPSDGTYTWAQFANGNITPTEGTSNYSDLEFGDTTNGLVLDSNNVLHLYFNGVDSAYYSLATGATYPVQYILFFGIDEENQRGSFWIAQRRQLDRWGYSIAGGRLEAGGNTSKFYNSLDGYNWIKAIVPVEYNWQSVPSISGKNGILSLVTLDSEAINDGEPVSGAAVSVFDQAPSTDNNVKDLADTYGSGEESSAVDVTVKYKVTLPPGGAFSVLKLVAKKDSIPEDATDGDKIVDISPTKTKKTVTGLDENSMYYFKIFAEDSNSNTSESDEKHILTSGDEGYNFDYTGEIVEWTVPKTGIYSLETWGAQGGNATDRTNSARGGYGAYAYGEVLLTQGEKLYINVGGQNGYNGGGNYTPSNE